MKTLALALIATAAAAIVSSIGVSHGHAKPLSSPQGHVILVVSGDIENTNVGETAAFDRTQLEALSSSVLETSTPWTEGVQRFDGFPLSELLELVGAKGTDIRAAAINDYAVTMPVTEVVEAGAFVATRQNGAAMQIRDRGPLWILFPYDSESRLVGDDFLNWSIWQLKTLEIR